MAEQQKLWTAQLEKHREGFSSALFRVWLTLVRYATELVMTMPCWIVRNISSGHHTLLQMGFTAGAAVAKGTKPEFKSTVPSGKEPQENLISSECYNILLTEQTKMCLDSQKQLFFKCLGFVMIQSWNKARRGKAGKFLSFFLHGEISHRAVH